MSTRSRCILSALFIGLLVSFVAFSGIQSSSVRAQAPRFDDEDEDSDLPEFARGMIDKEDYLRLREQYVSRLRGLPNRNATRARIQAISEMERAEGDFATASPINNMKWSSVGPEPIPNGQTSPSTPVSGRVASIAVHPTNPNVVYVGTAQGGVYRSLDGGTTWRAIFDNAQSLAAGAIAIAPSDPTTIFVGTGEPNFSCDSYSGVGVYRITQADTAPVLAGPFNLDLGSADVMTGRAIGKIVVHPTDPNIIFVSTTSGIGGIGCDAPSAQPSRGLFRCINAMSATPTFTKLTVATANGGNRSIADIVMEPGNPANVLCTVLGFNGAGDGGVYRSTNALDASPTFTRTLTLGTPSATIRGQLAINKVGAVVTVLVASGEASGAPTCGTNGTLRKSINGGQSWSGPLSSGNGFCGGQCFYNIAIAIDPNNSSNVLLGGNVPGSCAKLISRSTDGGTNFNEVSAGVHADNHVAVFSPSNPAIAYIGTDGGIYKSIDGGASWFSINAAGFNATQFQSLALHPNDREFMIGGTQDNGTEFKRSDGGWIRSDGGDGGFALIDQNATNITNVTMYHTYFNQVGAMAFARVTDSDSAISFSWSVFGCGFTGVTPNGLQCTDNAVNFYAPMALGPGNPNTVYFGSDKLYRSTNSGTTMTVVSQTFSAGTPVSAIGISPQNDNVRIVGLNNGKVFATSTGANPLTEITGPIPAEYIARAVIDPTNSNTAYVTLSGFGLGASQHVWKTTNLSSPAPTWNAAGNGIPDIPTNAFVVDPANSNTLYAGTDIGVYRSTDGGGSWAPYGTGLPRVAVFDMAIQASNKVLRIATHGRGIWEISTSVFNVSPLKKAFAANGGSGTINVTGPNGPTWSAVSNDPWILVTDAGPGTGNGTVSYTVLPNVAATNRSGTITVSNQTFTVLQGAQFLDVPIGAMFYDEIGRLSAYGITTGCGGGNYCPNDPVLRDQMAAFIIRAMGDTNPYAPAGQRFNDVPSSNPFFSFIEQMAVRGITSGCGGGNYCPSQPVLREQMSAFMIRAIGEFSPPTPPSQRFDDVPSSNPFYNFVDRMAVLNITFGCSASPPLYCPSQAVLRSQMAAFLVRAFNL